MQDVLQKSSLSEVSYDLRTVNRVIFRWLVVYSSNEVFEYE